MPGVYMNIDSGDIEKLFADLEPVTTGMASEGPAAAYALVWEWGNIRQTKPGPKTVIGTNPDGSMVWLSIQAPFGYIRINEPTYWNIVTEVMHTVDFSKANLQQELERAADRIMQAVVEVTQMTVPVDSGELRASLKVVAPGDPLLEEGGFGVLDLGV
jgi:hypothetical protein